MNRFLLGAVAGAFVLASCSGKSEYVAEYAPMDSVPFNIETNVEANSYLVHNYPNVVMFRVEYPQYNAVVKYGMVHSADSARLMKAYVGQLNRMGDRVFYSYYQQDTVSGPGVRGWIFTSLPDKTPLQMIVTDSATMMLHGKLEFTVPQTDTAGVIKPAVKAITADMEHMVRNLELRVEN